MATDKASTYSTWIMEGSIISDQSGGLELRNKDDGPSYTDENGNEWLKCAVGSMNGLVECQQLHRKVNLMA